MGCGRKVSTQAYSCKPILATLRWLISILNMEEYSKLQIVLDHDIPFRRIWNSCTYMRGRLNIFSDWAMIFIWQVLSCYLPFIGWLLWEVMWFIGESHGSIQKESQKGSKRNKCAAVQFIALRSPMLFSRFRVLFSINYRWKCGLGLFCSLTAESPRVHTCL